MIARYSLTRISLRQHSKRLVRPFSASASHELARMQLIGRLADTPEITPTSTGRDVIKYALGVGYGPRDENGKRQTSWYRVSSFVEGPQKDYLASLPKGTLLFLDADARMETYQTADGTNQTSLSLVQRSIETLSRPRPTAETGHGDSS